MVNQEEIYPFSEAHYHLAMQAASVGMWERDMVHDRHYWSEEFRNIIGVSPECEANHANLLAQIHPDDRAMLLQDLEEDFHAHPRRSLEFRVIWPDGSIHWIMAQSQFRLDERGEALSLIGVVIDITARKEAEETRLHSERRIREILEGVGEAFAHVDRNWCFTYVNSRAEYNLRAGAQLFLKDVLGRSLWEVYPEMLGTPVEVALRQVMENRKPEVFELYYQKLRRWYTFHTYPADDGGITNFITDITDRKTLERERDRLLKREQKARKEAEVARQYSENLLKELEQQQAFLRVVIDQAPSGLIIAEAPSGKITFANEKAIEWMGEDLRQIKAFAEYTQYEILHTNGVPYEAEECPMARALLRGEMVVEEEMVVYNQSGKQLHILASAVPIRNEQGEIFAAVMTFHDTTERYELERRKDEFITMASHELRTPLTSLRGNLQLAERRLKQIQETGDYLATPEARVLLGRLITWIERALRQAKTESRLINDLLDATRIQTEALHVELEPCNLVKIVSDAVDDVRMMAETRTITLALPKRREIPVQADSVRIGQVVTNYLTNALKYSAESQPVNVGVDLSGDEACVWVKDAGRGLSPEAQKAVWDRFYRLSNFADYIGLGAGGLGLGLYVNREIIRQHGGNVGVSSEVGQGSIFWFTLPLREK
jgi:PAS domain S-box-containing protein